MRIIEMNGANFRQFGEVATLSTGPGTTVWRQPAAARLTTAGLWVHLRIVVEYQRPVGIEVSNRINIAEIGGFTRLRSGAENLAPRNPGVTAYEYFHDYEFRFFLAGIDRFPPHLEFDYQWRHAHLDLTDRIPIRDD